MNSLDEHMAWLNSKQFKTVLLKTVKHMKTNKNILMDQGNFYCVSTPVTLFETNDLIKSVRLVEQENDYYDGYKLSLLKRLAIIKSEGSYWGHKYDSNEERIETITNKWLKRKLERQLTNNQIYNKVKI